MLTWLGRRVSNIIIGLLVAAAVVAAVMLEPTVTKLPDGCGTAAAPPTMPVTSDVAVADATGDQRIDVVIPADGRKRVRQSAALAIQGESALPPGTPQAMALTDFRRDDGDVIPAYQIKSVALVGRDGRSVTVHLCVSPRHQEVSGFGKYVGATSLDDPRARGANVAVDIHVTYPFVNRVLLWALLAALAGLIWTWLMRLADQDVEVPENEPWTLTSGIHVASILVAVPVVIKLVVDNNDWPGKLSSYVALAVAVGAAVIAAAPTFRALASGVKKKPATSADGSPAKDGEGSGSAQQGGRG